MAGVRRFDVDALQANLDDALSARQSQIPQVEAIIAQEIATWAQRSQELTVEPVIVDLRQKAEAIRQRELERTLRFLPGAAPGTADVRFADDRPFHDLDLTTGRWHPDHPCVADLYRGEFAVNDEDHWRTTWRVSGPAKDQLLVTDYTRDPPAGTLPTGRRPAAGSSGPRGPRP